MIFSDVFIRFVNMAGSVQGYFSLASIPVNLFVIILSVWKVPSCLVRTYTMFMSTTTFTAVVYSTIYFAIQYYNPQSSISMRSGYGHIPFVVDNFLSYLAANVYYFQSTIATILAYVNYKQLFFFQNVSKRKYLYLPFSVGFLLATSMAVCQTVEMVQSKMKLSRGITVALASLRATVQVLFMSASIGFCVLAVLQMIRQALQAKLGTIRQNRWNVFRSMLLYSMAPNLFLLAAIPDSICSSAMSNSVTTIDGLTRFDVFCVHVFAITQYMNPPRLFVISTSCLIAFEEYRSATLDLFGCLRRPKNASARTEVLSEVLTSTD